MISLMNQWGRSEVVTIDPGWMYVLELLEDVFAQAFLSAFCCVHLVYWGTTWNIALVCYIIWTFMGSMYIFVFDTNNIQQTYHTCLLRCNQVICTVHTYTYNICWLKYNDLRSQNKVVRRYPLVNSCTLRTWTWPLKCTYIYIYICTCIYIYIYTYMYIYIYIYVYTQL